MTAAAWPQPGVCARTLQGLTGLSSCREAVGRACLLWGVFVALAGVVSVSGLSHRFEAH
jgi:hypothetical protein